MIKPNMTASEPVRVLFNIGATMDIPTGWFVVGKYGENILLGGLANMIGISGKGNNFKSTLLHYMVLSAASRISNKQETSITTHDTESNMHEDRLHSLTQRFPEFAGKNLFQDGTWIITDKTVCYGNKWFEELKKYLIEKKKASKDITVTTPFLNRDAKTQMTMLMPTFSEIDSFSEFETDDVAAILTDTEIGDKDGNMLYMRQGLAKNRFLMEFPTLGGGANHYMLTTAHFGKEKAIASGPYQAPPTKKMNHMKPGDQIKGVPDKYFYLTHSLWLVDGSTALVNKGTKGCEFPKDAADSEAGDVDLYEAPLKMLRCKSGQSGYTLNIVVSQTEGVLPSLTEFLALKNNEWFGLSGNDRNYTLDLYPSVNMSRTTVRSKIDGDLKLQRALNISCELMQMKQFYRHMRNEVPTPKELLDGLTAKGYDIDMILEKTRGWWTINNDDHPLLFLSSMDLINMVKGTYHPYWLEEDKKTIKKQFLKS